jgi:hypothetical protein
LLFHPLPAPTDEDVARTARAVRRKISRYLQRRTGICDDKQASFLDSLANASAQGLVATGPRRGCRVLRLGTEPEDGEATIRSKRCAEVGGFNLHANVRVRVNEREGIEHLCR